MKLSDKQKREIIAAYAGGGVSKARLAKLYGVSCKTIYNVIKSDSYFADKVLSVKKENERSMLEYIAAKRGQVQTLLDALLTITPDMIEASPLRERMGAIKILTECFTDGNGAANSAQELDRLCAAIEKNAAGDGDKNE